MRYMEEKTTKNPPQNLQKTNKIKTKAKEKKKQNKKNKNKKIKTQTNKQKQKQKHKQNCISLKHYLKFDYKKHVQNYSCLYLTRRNWIIPEGVTIFFLVLESFL